MQTFCVVYHISTVHMYNERCAQSYTRVKHTYVRIYVRMT